MANEIEGTNTPDSATNQVLESLKAEGHVIDDTKSAVFGDDEQVIEEEIEKHEEEPKVEEVKKDEPKPEDKKPEREHSYVPAWKLKVAEDQKAKAEARYQEAQSEIERLSHKPEMTKSDEVKLDESFETLADEFGVDKSFLARLEKVIDSKTSIPKDITEKLKELDVIKEARAKDFQETSYLKEFDKDVLPLIQAENPDISTTALSEIKENLKKYAFSEEYAKLPLSKIFKVEKETLGIPAPSPKKKSVESSRSGAVRSAQTIDFDNMTEDGFKNLTGEQMIEFSKYKAGRR